MTTLTIRKSGGAHVISIPKAILEQVGLQTGSLVDMTIENDHIVLMPKTNPLTLESLLAGSPKEKLALLEEDREWLSTPAIGKEIIG
jgi:antitoxin ChpS